MDVQEPTINLDDPKYHSIRNFRVVRFVDQGRRANVFKVADKNRTIYALKVAREDTEERFLQAIRSFASEPIKTKTYKELGLAHASIIQSHTTFIVKEWVEGMRGDAWIKQWTMACTPHNSIQATALRKLVHTLSKRGVYVGDLNAKNVIWKAGRWVIVDSGSIRRRLTFDEAITRYVTNIPKRWGKHGDGSTVSALEALLS